MTRLDNFLAYAVSHRLALSCAAAVLIVAIAWIDWAVPNTSLGFLYLIPILLSAAGLRWHQFLTMAVGCGLLR